VVDKDWLQNQEDIEWTFRSKEEDVQITKELWDTYLEKEIHDIFPNERGPFNAPPINTVIHVYLNAFSEIKELFPMSINTIYLVGKIVAYSESYEGFEGPKWEIEFETNIEDFRTKVFVVAKDWLQNQEDIEWTFRSKEGDVQVTKELWDTYLEKEIQTRFEHIFTESIEKLAGFEIKTNGSLVLNISNQLLDDGVSTNSFKNNHPSWSVIQDCRCRFAQKMSTENTLIWYGLSWAEELKNTSNAKAKASKSSMISRFMKSVGESLAREEQKRKDDEIQLAQQIIKSLNKLEFYSENTNISIRLAFRPKTFEALLELDPANSEDAVKELNTIPFLQVFIHDNLLEKDTANDSVSANLSLAYALFKMCPRSRDGDIKTFVRNLVTFLQPAGMSLI
jgi:hypothetical protein